MTLTSLFSEQEWALLSGALRLKPAQQCDPRSLPARALLDETTCERLLLALGPVIGSPTLAITASLLAKRFSFLSTGACLYAMSVYDKGLRLSLDNCRVEYGHDDGVWTSSMPLDELQPFDYPPGSVKPGARPSSAACSLERCSRCGRRSTGSAVFPGGFSGRTPRYGFIRCTRNAWPRSRTCRFASAAKPISTGC